MNIGHSLYSAGLVGMQNSLKQMQHAADSIAKTSDPNQDVDLNESSVEMLQSELQLGSLIDTEA
jgi:hypothetical protein